MRGRDDSTNSCYDVRIHRSEVHVGSFFEEFYFIVNRHNAISKHHDVVP